jgi:hypothetical protein
MFAMSSFRKYLTITVIGSQAYVGNKEKILAGKTVEQEEEERQGKK